MTKPTIKQFFGILIVAWFLIAVFVTHQSGNFLHGIIAANITVIFVNCIGMFVGMTTGFYPWRD